MPGSTCAERNGMWLGWKLNGKSNMVKNGTDVQKCRGWYGWYKPTILAEQHSVYNMVAIGLTARMPNEKLLVDAVQQSLFCLLPILTIRGPKHCSTHAMRPFCMPNRSCSTHRLFSHLKIRGKACGWGTLAGDSWWCRPGRNQKELQGVQTIWASAAAVMVAKSLIIIILFTYICVYIYVCVTHTYAYTLIHIVSWCFMKLLPSFDIYIRENHHSLRNPLFSMDWFNGKCSPETHGFYH
jgi:hypothetical protein